MPVLAGFPWWINGVSPPQPLSARVLWHTLLRDRAALCPGRVLQYDSTYTFIETRPGPGNVARPRVLSGFTFLHGPRFTYRPGPCFHEGGMSSRGPSFGQDTHTHKLHMQGLGTIHGGGLICPLQLSFLAVLYTCRHGVGGVFLSWGRGLNGQRDIFSHCTDLELLKMRQQDILSGNSNYFGIFYHGIVPYFFIFCRMVPYLLPNRTLTGQY